MPRYHLHLRGGWQDQEDTVGVELPDAFSAELVAMDAARRMLEARAYVDENIELQQWFEIVDGAGVLQAITPFWAAIDDHSCAGNWNQYRDHAVLEPFPI